MHSYIVDLSHLYPSISYANVWDLPFFIFRGYCSAVDSWRDSLKG